jgi:hypothetical protein
MGYRAHERDPLSIHSKRSVEHLKDGVVWVIEGTGGTPKRFGLAVVFLVNETDESSHEGFQYVARGPGRVFRAPPEINELGWFPEFFKRVGHFGLGITPITEGTFIDGLVRLVITSE